MNSKEKLLHWSIFNVVIALSPLIFNFVFRLLKDTGGVSIHFLFARGELLLICAAIAADAVGEFMIGTIQNKYARLLTGGSCVVLLMLSSLFFAAVASADTSNEEFQARITSLSMVIFVATMTSSGISKYLSR